MLTKATRGDIVKWFWFFYHVLWSDRITVRKKLGCSPFVMVTGAQPMLLLDVPSWHINAHGANCHADFGLSFRDGVGRTCGEEVEST